MADEIQFVNGLIVKAPRDGAPDFVKAAISIKVDELKEWLNTQAGWVNIDVKESKAGKWYAQVSTFKPQEGVAKGSTKPANATKPAADTDDGDIPF